MSAAYVLHALRTAFRTLRFGGKVLGEYDRSFEGFFRSFFAAVIALPVHIFLSLGETRVLADAQAAAGGEGGTSTPGGFSYSFSDLGLYALDWLVFPIVMIGVSRMIGASGRYVPYIVAYNWGSLIVLLATVPPYLAYLAGVVALSGFVTLYYIAIAFVLGYRWVLARDALEVPGLTAAGIVILDILISAVVIRLAAQSLGLYS